MTDVRPIEYGMKALAKALQEYSNTQRIISIGNAVSELRLKDPDLSVADAKELVEEIYNGQTKAD